MAKTNGVNKSKAIRDYFKSHKKAKPQEVVDALAKQGITTTANYVSNLKPSTTAQQGGAEGRRQGRRRHPRGQGSLGFHQAHGEHYGGEKSSGSGSGD